MCSVTRQELNSQHIRHLKMKHILESVNQNLGRLKANYEPKFSVRTLRAVPLVICSLTKSPETDFWIQEQKKILRSDLRGEGWTRLTGSPSRCINISKMFDWANMSNYDSQGNEDVRLSEDDLGNKVKV